VDVAIVTVIVYLHPFLSFSEDGSNIEVLQARKTSMPGARFVNQNSTNDQQLAARQVREGQGRFRQALLEAYSRSCCITNTSVIEVLDAAHIEPYSVNQNSDSTNGLLLRTDIHNLFDDGLIKIDPDNLQVKVDRRLNGTEYANYNNLILANRNDGSVPDALSLEWHWQNVKP
jgi:predicted restriction endonuclease